MSRQLKAWSKVFEDDQIASTLRKQADIPSIVPAPLSRMTGDIEPVITSLKAKMLTRVLQQLMNARHQSKD